MYQKHITVITGYFYPEDTAIGLYTTQFCDFLVQQGYKVSVITGYPYYPAWKIADDYQNRPSPHQEIVRGMIAIVPLTFLVIPARNLAVRCGAKLWVHVQDFEFDLALESGVLKKNSFAIRLVKNVVRKLEQKMLNSATIVSSISSGMLQKARDKSKHQQPFYFPNWVSGTQISPQRSSRHSILNPNKFTLLYSGNIGEKQDWQFLQGLCELVSDPAIEILIVGDGGARKSLELMLSRYEFVRFHQPLPYEELNDLICHAQVHFLFQKTDILDSLMPSKILGMMASARPSIVTGNSASEVALNFKKSGGGSYFSDGNPNTVYQQILEWKNHPEKAEAVGKNARHFILHEFSDDAILNRFKQKIEEIL